MDLLVRLLRVMALTKLQSMVAQVLFTAGNTVKAGDVIMGNQSSGGQNGNFVTGLDNKTWNPNNPVAVTRSRGNRRSIKAVNDDFNEKS